MVLVSDFSQQPKLSHFPFVKASDKCHGESECLSFAEHMMALTQTWKRHLNETGGSHNPTVVFTTEAKGVVEEQQAWVKNNAQAQSPFDFDFVTNARDLLPDTGFMRHVGPYRTCNFWFNALLCCCCLSSWFPLILFTAAKNLGMESDPDANMLSSVSSLKLQLLSRVSIGNCCSNFHAMLNDFLSEGCGAASENTFVCLQEYDDPLLRVCCGWHKECLAQKNAYRAALLNNTTAEEAHRF